jgi:hypothetical protein
METQTLDIKNKKNAYVTIITHESFFVDFELTNADILTQFFTDYNNIRTGVRTYIVNDKVDNYLDLVKKPNYTKQLVNLTGLSQIVFDQDDMHEVSPVKFFFCHGSGRTSSEPAFINFGEEIFDHRVWACKKRTLDNGTEVSRPNNRSCIHDLITKTPLGKVYTPQLVIMMCCAGNEILEDYLSEQGNNIPDILVYKCESARRLTHHIFVILLINLLDSDDRVLKDPSPEDLHGAVKNGIITIFKIVKWCDDDKGAFWDFLLDVGCMSDYETEKQKEGLPCAVSRFQDAAGHSAHAYYRLSGHMNNLYITENIAQEIFTEFQKLTLISKGEEKPVEQNYMTVEGFIQKATSSTLKEVLYDYVQDINESTRPRHKDTSVVDTSKTSSVDLWMLLCQMKELSS